MRESDEHQDERLTGGPPFEAALDELGRVHAEALAAEPTAADAESARAFFEPRFEARAAERRRSRIGGSPLAWGAAAAVLALLVGTWTQWGPASSDPSGSGSGPSVPLGQGVVQGLNEPAATAASFATFRWSASALPLGGRFVVTVRDEHGQAVVESEPLESPWWSPQATERARLEALGTIEWEVLAIDANGIGIGSAWARSSLSKR